MDSQQELLELDRKLTLAHIEHILVIEGDKPYVGQATAIGLSPAIQKSIARKLLSNIPLLKNLAPQVIPGSSPCGTGAAICTRSETVSRKA